MTGKISVVVDHDLGADFPIKLRLEPAGSNRVRIYIDEGPVFKDNPEDHGRVMYTEVDADDLVRAALVLKTATAPQHYGETA